MKDFLYTIIEHTADIGIEVEAEDLAGLYRKAALAFFDLLVGLETIDTRDEVRISVEGSGTEELMVTWLDELLYLFDTDGWLFSNLRLELEDLKITATARGELFNPQKHQIRYYIKAVTYHMLEVRKDKQCWRAKVIFDI